MMHTIGLRRVSVFRLVSGFHNKRKTRLTRGHGPGGAAEMSSYVNIDCCRSTGGSRAQEYSKLSYSNKVNYITVGKMRNIVGCADPELELETCKGGRNPASVQVLLRFFKSSIGTVGSAAVALDDGATPHSGKPFGLSIRFGSHSS